MKKIKILFTVVVCFGFYQSFSQSMYAQFSIGYGLPSGAQQIGYEQGYNGLGDYSEKSVNGSYGAGLNATGSFGYMFTPTVGLDVSVNYLLGNTYESSYTYTYGIYEEKEITETRSTGIFVTPSLLINFGGTKFSPYAKLGVALGSVTLKSDFLEQDSYDGDVEYTEKYEEKTTGEFSIGIRGGVGLAYTISGNISLFGECIYTGMSYRMKESEVTSFTVNGQDQLGDLNESQKRTVYVKEWDGGSESFPPDEPREALQTPTPLSSISFNVGVRFSFGGI